MKSPAFQFYPADYLADARVQSLSIEGEGCYIRLMCYCWREGSIPSNRAAIARLCKAYDGPGLDEAIALFVRGEKRGTLVHKRIEKERSRQTEHSKLMQEAGLRGAIKRWKLYSQATQRPIAKNGSSSSSSASALNPPLPPSGGRKKTRFEKRRDVGKNGEQFEGAHERNLKRFPWLAEGDKHG